MGLFDAIATGVVGMANVNSQNTANAQNYGLGMANLEETRKYNQLNYENQIAMQEYNKQMQANTWAREDTAVQRRAMDLEAAGMSKTLAAGGAAQTSAPVHIDPAQHGTISGSDLPQRKAVELPDFGAIIRSAMVTDSQIQANTAQAHLADMQANRVEEERKGLSIENLVKEDRVRQELDLLRRDYILKGQDVEKGKEGVTQAQLKTIMDSIQATIAKKYGMSNAETENLARSIAAQTAGRDLDISKTWGIRSTDHPEGYFLSANALMGQLSESYNAISKQMAEDMERKQAALDREKAASQAEADKKKAMKDIEYARYMDLHQKALNRRWQ